ncbi:hypothetical protein LP2241_60033 [Pseudolactococcus piscium]|nr:hypothetical protein LP2241_60033 [Lactococcus piscium]
MWLVYLRKSEVATYLERKSNEKEKTFISDRYVYTYFFYIFTCYCGRWHFIKCG